MELYWNPEHTAYAILISRGYGAGWSTWSTYPEIAYDRRVIEWYLEHNSFDFFAEVNRRNSTAEKEAEEFFNNLGYHDVYFGGLQKNMIEWIPSKTSWYLEEHDGAERLVLADSAVWNNLG